MLNLIKTAHEVASSGVIVNINVNMWKGVLPRKKEWGNVQVYLFPKDIRVALRTLERKINENLELHSIPCRDGFFVPNLIFDKWITLHNEYVNKYDKTRDVLMSLHEELLQSAKSVTAEWFSKSWLKKHPGDTKPPPSAKIHASNLAVSLIPRKEKFYDLYRVEVRFNQHSFSFVHNNPKFDFLNDGEKREMAWRTIDELVTGNINRLNERLKSVTSTVRLKGNKIRYATKVSRWFLNTDLFPKNELGIRVQKIMNEVEGKTFNHVDKNKFNKAVYEVLELTSEILNLHKQRGVFNDYV